MSVLLHITNGDGAANILKACGVGGDALPWRDPMHHGPFPALHSIEELSRVRIGYLTGKSSSPQESVGREDLNDFSDRDATLANFDHYDEVVLWFEHDLLDQLQILYLLNWFATQDLSGTRLSLICINQFNGVPDFRGIGQLNAEQMASLFAIRQTVTDAQLDIATRLWSAFCSAEPHTLLSMLNDKSTDIDMALPFMNAALKRHCQEFPWVSDGLSRTERQLLTLIDNGVTSAPRIFVDNMDHESCLYIGDWRTYTQISQLSAADKPLLACVSGKAFIHPASATISADDFRSQELCLTDYGKQVVDGKKSAAEYLQRDFWLGGVRLLSGPNMWFWDDHNSAFKTQST